MTIDLYVHAMAPSEKGININESKVEEYEQALFDQIASGTGRMIIISASLEKDQRLVRLAEEYKRDFVQVISKDCLKENGKSLDTGFLKSQDRAIIEEIAEAESVVVNGSNYGDCPTYTIMQALFMKSLGQYFPQCAESNQAIPRRDFEFNPEEREKYDSECHVPENWRYGIVSSPNTLDYYKLERFKDTTIPLTGLDTRIYFTNKISLGKGLRQKFELFKFALSDPEEEAVVKQSIVR